MKKLATIGLVLLVVCTGASFAQGIDLTDARQVHDWLSTGSCAAAKSLPQPWKPAPGPDDDGRADGQCWNYDGSNYSLEDFCSFSPYACLDNCLRLRDDAPGRLRPAGGASFIRRLRS